MQLQSLDPRINRLAIPANDAEGPTVTGNQFATYEVFQQLKEGKPYEHTGAVHAPDASMAILFAKEQYSRRGNLCSGMCVIPTAAIWISPYTDAETNIFDTLPAPAEAPGTNQATDSYLVFLLKKRGKQHLLAGKLEATGPEDAVANATPFRMEPCVSIWVAKATQATFIEGPDSDIWNTLNEKKYRDAINYKAADRINTFKQQQAAKQ